MKLFRALFFLCPAICLAQITVSQTPYNSSNLPGGPYLPLHATADNSTLLTGSGGSTLLGDGGSGFHLFGTLGVTGGITAASYNGLTVTNTTGTLNIVNGKTAAFSNTLTLAGIDGSTLNVGAGGTLSDSAFAILDTDGTLFANSDTKIATQKAVKTYVDSASATSLATAGYSVNVAAAASPTTGQVLSSTNSTHATWQALGTLGNAVTIGTTNDSLNDFFSYTFDQSFTNSIGKDMYLAIFATNSAPGSNRVCVSNDGVAWSILSDCSYIPAVSGAGNNSVLIKDGYVWMIYSRGGTQTTWGVAKSKDLSHWSLVANPSVAAIGGVTNVWAPEVFTDDDGTIRVYFSVSVSGSGGPFAIYEQHATASDLTTWSAPVAVSGTVFSTSRIDPYMTKSGGVYKLWYKNETDYYIENASSTSPTSGFNTGNTGNWLGFGTDKFEGPCIVQVSPTVLRLYCDHYNNPVHTGISYADSSDGGATFSAMQTVTSPVLLEHGSVVKINALTYGKSMIEALADKRAFSGLGNYALRCGDRETGLSNSINTLDAFLAGNQAAGVAISTVVASDSSLTDSGVFVMKRSGGLLGVPTALRWEARWVY